MLRRMERCSEDIPLGLLSMVVLWVSALLCSAKEMTMLTLDSRAVCSSSTPSTIHWASKDKTIVVVGRGAHDRQFYSDCSVVIGAATAQSSILQLRFQAFHIEDCGVTLAINQSHRSDFASGSSAMAKVGCKHGNLKMLHSQEKHYIKIGVHKDIVQLQQYNFRINVTVVDKLPETGPETHVVVIVGITVLIVVGTALWLLVKYLIHRTQRWQEHCAERNMERAIRLYNSQETPPESDYMYTALPPQDVVEGTAPRQLSAPAPASASHRNGHCHPSKSAAVGRGGRHRAGEITFVHADGHIETFRMRGSPQERRLADSDHLPAFSAPRTAAGMAPSGRDRDPGRAPCTPAERDREEADTVVVVGDHGNGDDILGECPPSYEEALHMPTPHDPRSPLYVNLDTKNDHNHNT
ncbi:hypothetical protein ACOMHN_036286 [Nucella lapillus]